MTLQVSYVTYFGDKINLNLPDDIIGLILSFIDINAVALINKLNSFLKSITIDDMNYLIKINNLTLNDCFSFNNRFINNFINIMTNMPLLYEVSKNKMLGHHCKHRIERIFDYGLNLNANRYYFFNKKIGNQKIKYMTSGKLKLVSNSRYVDRVVTVLSLILYGFKRIGNDFLIKEVIATKKKVFENRNLTIIDEDYMKKA